MSIWVHARTFQEIYLFGRASLLTVTNVQICVFSNRFLLNAVGGCLVIKYARFIFLTVQDLLKNCATI